MKEILQNRERPPREIVRPAQQLPGGGTIVVGGEKKPTLAPVIQKVTVTTKVNADKKQRKKKIKAASKTVKKGKRAEYNALKRKLKKTFVTEKNSAYSKGNEDIKKMNVKQRAVARKKLRATLKAKMSALIKLLPAAGKRTSTKLATLISKVKRLKWT